MSEDLPIVSDEELRERVKKLSTPAMRSIARMIVREERKKGGGRFTEMLMEGLLARFMEDRIQVVDGWDGQP